LVWFSWHWSTTGDGEKLVSINTLIKREQIITWQSWPCPSVHTMSDNCSDCAGRHLNSLFTSEGRRSHEHTSASPPWTKGPRNCCYL
jgi:hypothetical protein